MEKNKQIEEYIQSHPHQFKDEIDKWLFREFSLLGGACSAQLSMQYSTAREVAEKAFEYAKEQMPKWKRHVSFCSYADDSVSIDEYIRPSEGISYQRLRKGNYYIPIEELEKLPKED